MPKGNEIVTARDLNEYLLSLASTSKSENNRIILGDPGIIIKKIGTVWTPYMHTLRMAVDLGINVLVVYAPTFYMDRDPVEFENEGTNYFRDTPSHAGEIYSKALEEKRQWIEENGLVIIRSRDLLDPVKIPMGLAGKLGYGQDDLVTSKGSYFVYRVKKAPAENFARKIAESLMDLNQPGIAFYGDPGRIVCTLGIGTGELCDPRSYADLNPDMSIGVDDSIWTWLQTSFAEDTGKPLVVINQGTSEEMGVRLLNEHLRRQIPSLDFIHLNQGCDYKWITA